MCVRSRWAGGDSGLLLCYTDWAVLHDIKGVDDSADLRTLNFVQQYVPKQE
jgi:hypothetical protein